MELIVWTILIGAVTAVTCSLCGLFLVLKREALVSEGLAHAVLPGIVIAFVILRDRSSPLLIVSAAAMGLLMIAGVGLIRRTGVVDSDASLGVVFPALFSFGILLANAELAGTHFHADCIIDGNLALAALDRLHVFGHDIGPAPFWTMLGMLLAVGLFLGIFFKEMKLMTFDGALAESLGFSPQRLHFAWLALVSLTTVTAFEAAGSVLVVALMIAPPAAAYLWTSRLNVMLVLAVVFGLVSAVLGFYVGYVVDVAPNGPMASTAGALFLVSLLAAPKRGLLARRFQRSRSKRSLEGEMLAARLFDGEPRSAIEVAAELGWGPGRIRRAAASAPLVVWDENGQSVRLRG